MTGSGGNIGGGACSLSITDFATSAAERIPRGCGDARLCERGAACSFSARFSGAVLAAAFGRFLAARTGFAAGLRTAGLSFSVAAGPRRAPGRGNGGRIDFSSRLFCRLLLRFE